MEQFILFQFVSDFQVSKVEKRGRAENDAEDHERGNEERGRVDNERQVSERSALSLVECECCFCSCAIGGGEVRVSSCIPVEAENGEASWVRTCADALIEVIVAARCVGALARRGWPDAYVEGAD